MKVSEIGVPQNSYALPIEERLRAREVIQAVGYAVLLLWLNAYICREMFVRYTPRMNSMQGFWIALARHAGGDWFHPQWWRFWDCGAPLEFVYAPLVPALSAGIAAIRGIPHDAGFQTVSGLVYCLGPVTLFVMAWLLTRAPGYAFAAAVLYSLTSPSQLILPDAQYSIQHFWDARRFYVTTVWDETPHMTAVAVLPLVILFLSLSFRKHRLIYYAAAALAIAICSLASDFGPVITAMASLCLLFVLRRQNFLRNLLVTAGIGLFSYAICCPFLSPSNILAIRRASANGDGGSWNAGAFTALAIVAAGWALLWRYLPRWTVDWRFQFFALFAWLTASVPLMAAYLNRQFLPEPSRYKVEMEFAVALLVTFATRPFFSRIPRLLKVALLFLLVAFAGKQIVSERRFAKAVLAPTDVTQRDVTRTIEYRTSIWARDHLPGVRIMLPGTIGKWADAFTDIEQFSGGSWSVAYNPVQQRAVTAIYNGGGTAEQDARVSIAWLKAFGAGAVAVSGPKSQEYWKGFAHPAKFDGLLPALWSEDDVTLYRIPHRSDSLAHTVPESALVRRAPSSPRDTEKVEQYVAALEDESLPQAEFRWEGENRIHIRTIAGPGQIVSVQITHHPGWHAKANGVSRQIDADGLGLMWLRPGCNGSCDVQLEYDGGTELRICRRLSAAALAALLIFFCWKALYAPALSFFNRGASSSRHQFGAGKPQHNRQSQKRNALTHSILQRSFEAKLDCVVSFRNVDQHEIHDRLGTNG
jgi:hypothetical protein